ncbi:MAG: hypothetical protein ACSHXD_19620, partial [Marinosulfonomonas sp.]
HIGYDEPEILRYENLKAVPQALTLDKAEQANSKATIETARRLAEKLGIELPDSVLYGSAK